MIAMAKPKVYVTRPIPEEALQMLKKCCNVAMNMDPKTLPKEAFIEKIKGFDALVVSGVKIDEIICQSIQGQCKILASYGVGYDNIDVTAATKYGIYVTNNPGVVTEATADLAFTLLLAVARRIVECDGYVRAGKKDWGPANLLGSQVSGKTIGIIGAGRIGKAVAHRAKGFNMKILYTDVTAYPDFEAQTGGRYVERETLLKEADFISIHAPLLDSTRHLIGEKDLKLMKKTAILVNASRGALIDEKALVSALRNGELAGAGLDVFEKEPLLEPGLTDLTNLVLTPHVGTSTMDTRIRMGEGCARNIFAAFEKKLPPNCVNPEVEAIITAKR